MSSNKTGTSNEQTKFTLVTAGLHGRVLNDVERIISPPKQITARSKGSTNNNHNNNNNNNNLPTQSQQQQQQQQQQNKPKPKRPSSANPRTRVSHQHREPGKPQKNHPILSNQQQNVIPQKKTEVEYEGRNFSVLNREELLEELTEIKKQQRNNETIIAQLRADNQRLESEVLKQQHRIDKLLSPQYSNNQHLIQEIRKDIEKSVLVRQLKAQMMTLRGTITEKETIIETLQKKTSTLNLIELTTEKEEYYQEIQRLKKIIAQKEKELQNEKNTHAWEKKGPITLEDNLRAEITRLSRGYQQVLERLENTAVATNTNVNKPNSPRQSEVDSVKLNRPLSGKSPRGSDASQTKNRPKSAGAKVPITSQNSNDVGYIDPILTTFDHKPSPSLSSSNKSNINQTTTTTTSTSVKGNLSNSTKNDLNNDKSNVKKEADFLYEMSEENVVGIGGESNVESYLTTAKGLSIPPTAPLPLGCKIQVKKRDNNLWEGRVIGFNEQKNTYDIQYDEGGREFDVLRSTIIVVGEQVSQPNITTSLNKNQTTTTTTTTSSSSSQNQPIPQTQNFFQSQNQPQLQPQVQKQQPIQSQTSTSFSSSNNPSPRKEAVIVKNKYQVGDSVEGNYQGGGSWYPGIIIGIIGNKYRVRYQDGDEEGNIIEDNIRLREKDKTSNSILVSNPSPLPEKISTSSEKIDQNENIPIYLPNDKVECRYRGKAKYYPGKIDTVNMDGTYNINYDDGEYEVNVSYIYIKKLGGDNNNFTSSSLPSQPQPQFQLQSSQNNNNNNSGNDSPDQFASQLNSPYPLYAVGNHIEGNYKSKGKWYPGKIGYVVNHGEAYTIEYDDGLIEENVKPINIKLKEVQYNIDSFLNDDDGDDTGGAVGLNTDDLLNDNYFTQLKANQNQNQNQTTLSTSIGEGGKESLKKQKQYDPFEDDDDQNNDNVNDNDNDNEDYNHDNNNEYEKDHLSKSQDIPKRQSQISTSSSSNSPKKIQPSVDINSFLAGLSDDEGDDVIGGNLDGGDSIHIDYGVCPHPKDGEDNNDELNQTDDYGEDFDD